MYDKNLTEDLRLRLSKDDMDFLRGLSSKRSVSVSECIRSIIGEYRRGLESINVLTEALKLVKENYPNVYCHHMTIKYGNISELPDFIITAIICVKSN